MERFAAIIAILCLCRTASAQSATASGAASQNARASYIKRIQIISRDTNYAIGQFAVAWQATDESLAKPRRQESAEEVDTRNRKRDAARVSLLKIMPSVRANAKRLRSVSPVPRFYKKADDRFIDAGYALESAMKSLELWLIQPSDLWESQTDKSIRKALTDMDAATRALSERSEAGVANKTYVD